MENKKNNPWSINFGSKGWGIVIIGMCFYYLCFSTFDVGMNTLFGVYTEAHGWSLTSMSSVITLGGWLSIVGIAIFGAICKKKGAKFVSIIGLIGVAVGYLFVANASSFGIFALGVILFFIFATGFGIIGVGQYGANWFPTKKGMYMGMVTMGVTAGAATVNLIMHAVIPSRGVSAYMYIFAAVSVILAIIVTLGTKNMPEEAGAYPDNDRTMTREIVDRMYREDQEYRKKSPWTLKKVLSTRDTWLIGIGWGIPMMAATGIMTHLVGTLMSFGHDMMFGIMLLSTMWPCGVAGNYIGGVIDTKFGTKAASYLVIAMEALAAILIIAFGANTTIVAIAVGLFMFAVSANTNVCMSMTTTVFGRQDFENAWPAIQIIYKVIFSSGVVLIAIVAENASYTAALTVIVIAVIIGAVLMRLTSNKQIASKTDSIESPQA